MQISARLVDMRISTAGSYLEKVKCLIITFITGSSDYSSIALST